jgi:O-antigen/teichoic acid export membrane protein
MNQNLDAKLGALLRVGSPPERDPAFRLAVLERQERRRYQRRLRTLVILAVMALVAPILVYSLATGIPAASLLRGALVAALIAALLAASVFSLRGVQQAARWMRRN